MAIVYIHKNPHNNEVFYVGMSTKDDLKRPFDFTNRNKYWHKYVIDNGKPIVEIIEKGVSNKEAWYTEISLIKEYGRLDLCSGTLLNLTNGGEFNEGKKHTEESKQKISKSKLGSKMPEGFQDGEKNHRFGKGYLQEGCNNPMFGKGYKVSGKNNGMYGMSGDKNPFYGKTHSKEFLEYKKKLHGKRVFVMGVEFDSIREASRVTGKSRYILKKMEDFKLL